MPCHVLNFSNQPVDALIHDRPCLHVTALRNVLLSLEEADEIGVPLDLC